jgi:prepilin-type N-terminal cleavage/methylation domain-containing protein
MQARLQIKSLSAPWERHPAAKVLRFSAPLNRPKGFTLIEVIVTIIAAGIMGAFFMNYMGTAMSRSTRAIKIVEGEARAQGIQSRIVTEYIYEMNRNPNTALATIVGRDYGDGVTMQYMNFVISGTQGNQQILSSGVSNTVRVNISSEGSDLTFLLTKSRLTDSPKVNF